MTNTNENVRLVFYLQVQASRNFPNKHESSFSCKKQLSKHQNRVLHARKYIKPYATPYTLYDTKTNETGFFFQCTLYDDQYSPMVEMMKTSIGQQYEIKLNRMAHNLKLAFRDETYLRKCGYDKTPDIKLEVPIAIDGFIVNWIESKALFGSLDVHGEYVKNQYLSYWNRFGTGLVIYWFGYVDGVMKEHDTRFIVRDTLPEQFTKLINT